MHNTRKLKSFRATKVGAPQTGNLLKCCCMRSLPVEIEVRQKELSCFVSDNLFVRLPIACGQLTNADDAG